MDEKPCFHLWCYECEAIVSVSDGKFRCGWCGLEMTLDEAIAQIREDHASK